MIFITSKPLTIMCSIHTKEGGFLKNRTMSHFEKSLDANLFVRTHRSYIVNVQQITRIDPYEKESYVAILKNGVKVSVSKTGYARLKACTGIVRIKTSDRESLYIPQVF